MVIVWRGHRHAATVLWNGEILATAILRHALPHFGSGFAVACKQGIDDDAFLFGFLGGVVDAWGFNIAVFWRRIAHQKQHFFAVGAPIHLVDALVQGQAHVFRLIATTCGFEGHQFGIHLVQILV